LINLYIFKNTSNIPEWTSQG